MTKLAPVPSALLKTLVDSTAVYEPGNSLAAAVLLREGFAYWTSHTVIDSVAIMSMKPMLHVTEAGRSHHKRSQTDAA